MEGKVKLKVSEIEKSFPGVKALNGVNFEVKEGSVHALCGENGAGKSTLMKIINGLHRPDVGSIYVDGEKIILKKYEPACIFCGNADGIRIFKDKNICKECFDLMKSVG